MKLALSWKEQGIQRKSKGRGEERPVGEGEVLANDGIHIAELEHEASFWIK